MSTGVVDKHVGERLRNRRKMLGLSQDDLGKSVSVTFQQIQKYERGDNKISSSKLYLFSKFLGVDVSYFFADFEKENALSEENASNTNTAFDSVKYNESREILRSFNKINDEMLRKKIVKFVKSLAATPEETTQQVSNY
ncbi:MAG: helix-turn-helix domain-containing protein [Alphaproteobacteria bacterium]